MTISTLSLPIDIPWRRLAISRDMFATSLYGSLPIKWRSSLAVFYYDPVDDQEPSNPDELTTFLKVIATVTGYQPEGSEVDEGAVSGGFNSTVIHNFEQLTNHSYPALSALVQVGVFPHSGKWDVTKYPYLTDFEPKKREMMELVSETGEALTQSATSLNVRKGTTSTNSSEIANIDRGGSFGLNISTPYGGGGVTGSHQQEVGTRATLGTQAMNITETDASREKRESFSHTTNLSQLYQLLDSYHAGTNRAIFFLNARPHIVDSPYTFVNGPRRIEGIQEYFLVVRRPKEMPDICVKAVLETAHLHESDTQTTTGTTTYDQGQLIQTFTLQASGGGDFHGSDDRAGQWTMQIPDGYHLDRSRGGGSTHVTWDGQSADPVVPAGVSYSFSFQTASGHEMEAIPDITTYEDHVDIRAHVYGWFGFGDTDGKLTLTVTVYTISVEPTSTPTTTTEHHVDLFITAREVLGCIGHPPETEKIIPDVYVAYEIPLPVLQGLLAATRKGGKEGAIAANQVGQTVAAEMVSSFRSSRRYEPGQIDFLHTRFALRDLLSGVEPVADQRAKEPLYRLRHLSDDVRRTIQKHSPDLTVGQALRLSPEELTRKTGLPQNIAIKLFTHALGVRSGYEFPSKGQPQSGATRGTTGKGEHPDAGEGSKRPSPQRKKIYRSGRRGRR